MDLNHFHWGPGSLLCRVISRPKRFTNKGIQRFEILYIYIYLYHTTSRKCFNPLALPTFVTQKCLNGVSCCGTMPNRVQPKSWSALLRLASGFLASTFASLSWELNHCGWLDRPLAISHGNRGTKCAFFLQGYAIWITGDNLTCGWIILILNPTLF